MRVVALAVPSRAPFAQPAFFLAMAAFVILLFLTASASATSVIPTTDRALYEGANVVVHGVVLSSKVVEALDGSPETVTVIEPLEVLKGGIPGNLVLRQAGGTLPDGRFFRLWGRPEFTAGSEVVVFAISRSEGDFQTAEMLLGKFEVWKDETDAEVAVSDLSKGSHDGVHVVRRQPRSGRSGRGSLELDSLDGPRDLRGFLSFLRNGAQGRTGISAVVKGKLSPVRHPVQDREITPSWAPISSLWRYSNGATAGWTLNGTANITGGGSAEAQRALATWTNEPNSTINHYVGGPNNIHLNALSSPCGWTTALPSSLGVVGCGGPKGSGSHAWRSETYGTIVGGEVWLRAYSSFNQLSSVVTESIILHELGHALGLGHSDQAASADDTCRGDESTAIMRSSVQSRTSLGTDDVDAVRWLYGDGGKSCGTTPPPSCTVPSITSQPAGSTINSGQGITLSVAASGTAPLSYQWYVGNSGNTGSALGGATGSSVFVTPGSTTSYWVRVNNGCGTANSSTATVTVNPPVSSGVRGDFNGDGRADIIWRNQTTGETHIWLMNGVSYGGSAVLPYVPVAWRVEAAADFNGDGHPDIVWRNYSTGETHIWLMNRVNRTGSVVLPPVPVQWQVQAAGDFNGDGRPDIVWRNTTTGETHIWLMNGTVYGGSAVLPVVPVQWRVEGAADYTGDGHADIVWRNGSTGETHIWTMNRTARTGSVVLSLVPVAWDVEGTGDYNQDGLADIIWRNYSTGDTHVWIMNQTVYTGSVVLPGVPTAWRPKGP